MPDPVQRIQGLVKIHIAPGADDTQGGRHAIVYGRSVSIGFIGQVLDDILAVAVPEHPDQGLVGSDGEASGVVGE
jgi:hypothetical protein